MAVSFLVHHPQDNVGVAVEDISVDRLRRGRLPRR